MNITFLGTSCMQPTVERNHPGVLLDYEGSYILFDCGENVQRQLKIAQLRCSKISAICLTHWHGDHVLGLPGLLQDIAASGYTDTLVLVGPPDTKKRVEYMLRAFESRHTIPLSIIETTSDTVLDTPEYSIECRSVHHGIPALGFRFVEKPTRKMNLGKIKERGIPVGPLLGKLQKGETITFQGKKIRSSEVTYLVPGRIMAYISDTLPCPAILALGKRADVLILESTYLDQEKEKAKEYKHLTALQSAEFARKCQVHQLVLFHFSQRYKKAHVFEQEARTIFPETIAAQDFMSITIPKHTGETAQEPEEENQ